MGPCNSLRGNNIKIHCIDLVVIAPVASQNIFFYPHFAFLSRYSASQACCFSPTAPAAANGRSPSGPAAPPPPAGPPGSSAGSGLNTFPAVPRPGGRLGGTAAFPAPADPAAVPVTVFSPMVPPQQRSEVASQPGGVTPQPGAVAPCLDSLQPHLGSRQPAPAAPPVTGTMAGPAAQSAVRPTPPAQAVFSPLTVAHPPAPSTSGAAPNPTAQTTAGFPPTVTSIPPAAGAQFADRPPVAPPSHRPPSGAAVPPPPKGQSVGKFPASR